jgi:hypothetical protein
MSKKKRTKHHHPLVPKRPKPAQTANVTPPRPGLQSPFNVGDSVVVKPGIQDPDFGVDIGGWQGRVTNVDLFAGNVLLSIEWDSQTLGNMPDEIIEQCEEEGLSWNVMNLADYEVEPARPRDSEQDAARAGEKIGGQHSWAWLGEEGRRIQKVLAGTNPDDIMAMLHAWEKHLADNLKFPFEAEVAEFQERGPLRTGDRVKVTGISLVDDLYGIVVHVRIGGQTFNFPLCDLEAIDKGSSNYEVALDYATWFANR